MACPALPIAATAEATRTEYVARALQTVPLDLLGVSRQNRGRLGLASHHVQEVVASIRDDGFSVQRYRDVCVIRVPDVDMAKRTLGHPPPRGCPTPSLSTPVGLVGVSPP